MAVELKPFYGGQKTLLDQKQLQDAFEAKKALSALAVQAQLSQVANGGLNTKDLMQFQMQQQKMQQDAAQAQAMMGLRQDSLASRDLLARDQMQGRIDQQNAVRDEKKDRMMAGDQNALNGALTGIDQQIADLDSIVGVKDAKGNYIKPPMQGVGGNFGLSGVFPNIPGGDSANAKAILDKAKAGTLLSGLSTMKSQSATGASGLGSLTEREGTAVQNAQASLQGEQSYESFLKNAEAYRNQLHKSRQNLIGGFNNIYKPQGNGQPMTVEVNKTSPQGNAQQIIVTNPQTGESLMIDPADLAEAQAEGFGVKQ